MDDLLNKLSPEAKNTLRILYEVMPKGATCGRVHAPYYYDLVDWWDIWVQAVDEIIPDEVNLQVLKPHLELAKHGLLELIGSDGNIAEFRFTRIGYELAKTLTETGKNNSE